MKGFLLASNFVLLNERQLTWGDITKKLGGDYSMMQPWTSAMDSYHMSIYNHPIHGRGIRKKTTILPYVGLRDTVKRML